MSHKEEFEKIRKSFLKVKDDMGHLSGLITNNTDSFFEKHKSLSNEVFMLVNSLKNQIEEIKTKNISTHPEIKEVKNDVKHLKDHMMDVAKNNADVYAILDRIKSNDVSINELKKRLDTDELEIHLLKERLLEKDFEVKKMKEVNSHMLNVIDELTDIEERILNV